MFTTKDNAINKAKQFVKLLNLNGIDVFEAYLFGSVIYNNVNENSDIDLAIVSKKFIGIPFYDIQKISKYRRIVDLKLEIHPFSIDDAIVDPTVFFIKIKNEGLQIKTLQMSIASS